VGSRLQNNHTNKVQSEQVSGKGIPEISQRRGK
jgi:hypothetical protein